MLFLQIISRLIYKKIQDALHYFQLPCLNKRSFKFLFLSLFLIGKVMVYLFHFQNLCKASLVCAPETWVGERDAGIPFSLHHIWSDFVLIINSIIGFMLYISITNIYASFYLFIYLEFQFDYSVHVSVTLRMHNTLFHMHYDNYHSRNMIPNQLKQFHFFYSSPSYDRPFHQTNMQVDTVYIRTNWKVECGENLFIMFNLGRQREQWSISFWHPFYTKENNTELNRTKKKTKRNGRTNKVFLDLKLLCMSAL